MTPRMLSFVIHGKPEGKDRPRFARTTKGVRTFTSAKTRIYETAVGHAARAAMRGDPPLAGAIEVSINAHYAVPASWSRIKRERALCDEIRPTTKPDLDNVAKGVLDALNGVAYADDAQVVMLRATKIYATHPGVFVRLTEVRHIREQRIND